MGLVTQHFESGVEHRPAAATQATITVAADAGGRHICKSITASIAATGTASGPEVAVLRDGAAGSGTVIWSCALSAPANGTANISVPMNLAGTKNTAMTLEFVAEGAANTFESVALTYYTEKENYLAP